MSLKRLVLRDFVIVSELELELDGGFTVLTGETGAGKSILIDALQLATGARAEAAVVREGASRTEVSAEFDSTPALDAWLEEAGFDRGESLLLRRAVDRQGKSRGWLNGSPATATQLRAIGEQLLDIHGQHAWAALTRPDAVRGLLDAYARLDTGPMAQCWGQWRVARRALEQARAAQDTLANERERLAWQIGDLEKLAPGADEWEPLNAEHARQANAQALLDAGHAALALLQDGEGNALDGLGRAAQLLQAQARFALDFDGLAEVLASSMAQVQDTVHGLRAALRNTEPDPQRLALLDERLASWLSMARRYKRSAAELPALLGGWKQELQTLDAAADLAGLERTEGQAQAAYTDAAQTASRARKRAAPELARAVTQAMQGLGMQGGRFEVLLQPAAHAASSGLEEVEFRVAAHTGSTPRPVARVASGGELSRIALAIGVTTSRLGTAQTLIFDEVDAGVGGAVAQTVGRLMKQLGSDRQVLAVTHLPQVAACADRHLVVSKRLQGGVTLSTVQRVEGEMRVAEIARMLGGERLSGTAHAKELLQARS